MSPMISSFKTLIDQWPHPDADVDDALASVRAFARDVGITVNNAKQMRRRDTIHSSHWLAIVSAARERGMHGVTLEALAAISADRGRGQSECSADCDNRGLSASVQSAA